MDMIDDRQYFIGKAVFRDWNNIALQKDMILSYHAKLPIAHNLDRSCVILGDAWQTDPVQNSPNEIIQSWDADTSEDEIYAKEESWCGRYILIVGSRLFQDATSQLTTFFDDRGNVSSSLKLLREASGGGILYPKIKHGMGFNYIPGPLTQYPSIRKVMASQVYDYLSGEIFERPLLPNGVREYTENSTKEFSRYFIYSLQEMKKTLNTDVMIALTGGYDSRTLISLVEQSGIYYECFTFKTEFMNTGGDVELPPQICKLLNRKHRIICFDKSDFSKERKEKYLLHSSGMAQDGDLHQYTYGQWDRVADGRTGDVTVLYSGIWEIAIEYFSTHTKGLKENPTCYQDIIKAFPDITYDKTKKNAIKLWLTNIEDSDYRSVMSDTNRFYWEQRDGCWMSYIAQSFDMIDHVQMIQPCNSRLFLSFLLGWPRSKRLRKEHQKEIIEYNMPELLNILFTDDYPKTKVSITENLFRKLKRYYYYTKWYGVKWVVDKMAHEMT